MHVKVYVHQIPLNKNLFFLTNDPFAQMFVQKKQNTKISNLKKKHQNC